MIAEFNGVKALLEGVPLLAGSVRDSVFDELGKVARGNYVVLFSAGPDDFEQRWGAVPTGTADAVYEFPVRAVGTDGAVVREIGSAVLSLEGRKPTVSGRRADPIEVVFEPAKVDNSVSPPLHFMNMWVRFTSRRA